MTWTPADRRALAEYLQIAADCLRDLANRDALHLYTSQALAERMTHYANHADTLRRKLSRKD